MKIQEPIYGDSIDEIKATFNESPKNNNLCIGLYSDPDHERNIKLFGKSVEAVYKFVGKNARHTGDATFTLNEPTANYPQRFKCTFNFDPYGVRQ